MITGWPMDSFRMLGVTDNPRAHAVVSGVTTEPRELLCCYTAGGRKIHFAWDDSMMTLCGSIPAQLVLAEDPLPDEIICEWCRAARDKEKP